MKMKGLLFRFFSVLAGLIAIMVLTLTAYLFRRHIVLQTQSNSEKVFIETFVQGRRNDGVGNRTRPGGVSGVFSKRKYFFQSSFVL